MSIFDRPILITGANGGIGSGLVKYFLDRGHRNIICQYRSDNELLVNTIHEALGSSAEQFIIDRCFKADLTNADDVAKLHTFSTKKVGNLWALVSLAGATTNSMSWKMPVSEFTDIVNANLLSTFVVCKEYIPELRAQNGGRIITTSSVVAFTGTAGAAHYSAAKAGIVGLTKSLALELASKNVTVNCLALGYFDYGMISKVSEKIQDAVKIKTPLGRFGKIEEVGGLVNYLISDEAAFTTGQTHHPNGGLYL